MNDNIDLGNGIVLEYTILKDSATGEDIPAFEIFQNKVFQGCFIQKATVDKFRSLQLKGSISYDDFIANLSEVAEKTIRLANGIPEPEVAS